MLLVLNVGSSSLKAAVLQATAARSTELWRTETQRQGALQDQLGHWLAPQLERWWPEIKAAGHRVVHGGESFIAPTRITVAVLEQLNAGGVTLLVVTHDAALGARARRRLLMEDGAIRHDQLRHGGTFDDAHG